MFGFVKKSGRLSEECARQYFVHSLLALQYMHSSGLVHLDMSLENLMLLSPECCKVIDFGTATAVPDHSGGPLKTGRVGTCGGNGGGGGGGGGGGLAALVVVVSFPPSYLRETCRLVWGLCGCLV